MYCLFCIVLCIVCFVSFYVLFVCKCVLYCYHRVTTQLQLTNISYHTNQTTRRQNPEDSIFSLLFTKDLILCAPETVLKHNGSSSCGIQVGVYTVNSFPVSTLSFKLKIRGKKVKKHSVTLTVVLWVMTYFSLLVRCDGFGCKLCFHVQGREFYVPPIHW